jgi:hypothetical protein
MKRLISIIAIFTISMFFVSCGSSVHCTKGVTTASYTTTKGAVSDGPIYNANVKIETLDGKVLAETTTDDDGHYEVNVTDLPEVYRVRISGGHDKGVDSEKNANDENNTLEMSAIVTRDTDSNETNKSVGYITPATTLVDSIVEDGALPTDTVEDTAKKAVEAQKTVNSSFNLSEDTNLAKIDPTKDEVANKLANLIGLITKSIPADNKNVVLKSVAKNIKEKKINVSVSAMDVSIDDLNLTKIATDANISDEDVDKVEKVESVIKTQIENVVKVTKAAKFIEKTDKKDAVSAKSAFVELLKEIKNQEVDELNIDTLVSLVGELDKAIKSIIEGINLNATSPDDIDFIGGLVKNNLHKDSKILVNAYQGYKKVTKTTSIKVKKVIKYTYFNSNITTLTEINNKLNDSTLSEIDSAIKDLSNNEEGDLLSDMLGAKIAQNIEDGDVNVNDAINETIKNSELVKSIESQIQTKEEIKKTEYSKRTQEDKAKLIAVKKVVKDIKINIKIEKFTKTTAKNVGSAFDGIVKDLVNGYKDNIKTLLEKVEALNFVVLNLNQEFKEDTYKAEQKKVINNINIINKTKNIDRVQTIKNLSTKIIDKFVQSKGKEKLDIEDELENGDVKVALPPRVITLPLPTLKSMPESLKTPIKITL